MASPSNLLASPATQQQMLLNQVMNRIPQGQSLAQVMAQSMSQGVRIPFVNPYGNGLQLLASANNMNGLSNANTGSSSSNSGGSSNSNTNSASSSSSSTNSNSQSSNGEQQVAASSTNRAKFFSRLNPLNLFKRLRRGNNKNNNSKQNGKDQTNGNDINNNIPDLEDRSQFFLPAELLLGSASTNSQQQQLPQLNAQQQQFADQISAQLAQLNMQLAQQSNNKAKFLRKMGSNSGTNFVFPSSSSATSVKKVAKRDTRDVSNQLKNSSTEEQELKKETVLYTLGDEQSPKSGALKSNGTNSNDTETAENGFFPVADLYQNYKFNIRPRFRFPSAREQRRISNAHGLHVNTNNFLTSSSMKSNFIGLMGSRCV